VQVSAYGQGALCELFWIFGNHYLRRKLT
jgi:hypothetical protein